MIKKLSFFTTAGVEVEYTPASAVEIEMSEAALRKEYIERGEPLNVPTYTVQLAGSTPENPLTQTFEHDATTLQSDEDKAAWKAHLDALSRFDNELNELRTQIVIDCLKIELPEDTRWMSKQKRHHIELPTDEYELLHHYIRTEVLRSVEDIYLAMQKVIVASLSGSVDEAAIEASLKTFRNTLQQAGEQAVEVLGKSQDNQQDSGAGVMAA